MNLLSNNTHTASLSRQLQTLASHSTLTSVQLFFVLLTPTMLAESDESKGAAATCQKEKAYLQRTYKESEEALRELLRNR